jgi:hypothetical protein
MLTLRRNASKKIVRITHTLSITIDWYDTPRGLPQLLACREEHQWHRLYP